MRICERWEEGQQWWWSEPEREKTVEVTSAPEKNNKQYTSKIHTMRDPAIELHSAFARRLLAVCAKFPIYHFLSDRFHIGSLLFFCVYVMIDSITHTLQLGRNESLSRHTAESARTITLNPLQSMKCLEKWTRNRSRSRSTVDEPSFHYFFFCKTSTNVVCYSISYSFFFSAHSEHTISLFWTRCVFA